MRKPAVTVAVLAVALATVAFVQTNAGKSLARSLGLSAPEEPFTELYFTNPVTVTNLIGQPQPPSATLDAGFAIHNEEHVARAYRWAVSVDSKVVQIGAVHVRSGQTAYEGFRIAPCAGLPKPTVTRSRPRSPRKPVRTQVQVNVSLASPRQSIDVLVRCHG